jgi:hypothetical protein
VPTEPPAPTELPTPTTHGTVAERTADAGDGEWRTQYLAHLRGLGVGAAKAAFGDAVYISTFGTEGVHAAADLKPSAVAALGASPPAVLFDYLRDEARVGCAGIISAHRRGGVWIVLPRDGRARPGPPLGARLRSRPRAADDVPVARKLRPSMTIFATNATPANTRLMHVPVTVDGARWSCLLYTNDLTVPAGKPALTIVPFPNPSGAKEFGLLSASDFKMFRTQVFGAFRGATGHSAGTIVGFAPVLRAGGYKCSIAPDLAALRTAIDWSRFTVPDDIVARLDVLRDEAAIPSTCGFVVAEAEASVIDAGFGVVYPGSDVWFPVGHGPWHKEDVSCYAFDAHLPALPSTVLPISCNPDEGGLPSGSHCVRAGTFATFPRVMVDSVTGASRAMEVCKDMRVASFARIDEKARHTSLVGATLVELPAAASSPACPAAGSPDTLPAGGPAAPAAGPCGQPASRRYDHWSQLRLRSVAVAAPACTSKSTACPRAVSPSPVVNIEPLRPMKLQPAPGTAEAAVIPHLVLEPVAVGSGRLLAHAGVKHGLMRGQSGCLRMCGNLADPGLMGSYGGACFADETAAVATTNVNTDADADADADADSDAARAPKHLFFA